MTKLNSTNHDADRRRCGVCVARGFTLIEVTIAVMMMGIVAAACFTSLSVAYRAQRQIDRVSEPTRGLQLAIKYLERDISSILPPSGTLAGPLIGEHETGQQRRDADVVSFHTLTRQGVRRVEWAIEQSDEPLDDTSSQQQALAWNLVRREWANLLSPVEADPVTQVIARRVGGLRMVYFDGTDWLESWDSTLSDNQLPQAIEVRLKMQQSDDDDDDDDDDQRSASEDDREEREITRAFALPCAEPPAGGRTSG